MTPQFIDLKDAPVSRTRSTGLTTPSFSSGGEASTPRIMPAAQFPKPLRIRGGCWPCRWFGGGTEHIFDDPQPGNMTATGTHGEFSGCEMAIRSLTGPAAVSKEGLLRVPPTPIRAGSVSTQEGSAEGQVPLQEESAGQTLGPQQSPPLPAVRVGTWSIPTPNHSAGGSWVAPTPPELPKRDQEAVPIKMPTPTLPAMSIPAPILESRSPSLSPSPAGVGPIPDPMQEEAVGPFFPLPLVPEPAGDRKEGREWFGGSGEEQEQAREVTIPEPGAYTIGAWAEREGY